VPGKLTGCEDDFSAWFDHLEERFSCKRNIQNVLPASCPPAENVNESPDATIQYNAKKNYESVKMY